MASFILFGSIPLLPYLLALLPFHFISNLLTDSVQLWTSIFVTVLSLFSLGAVKGAVVEAKARPALKNGLLMALNGSFAAVLGFLVGWAMGKLVDVPQTLD